MIIAAMYIEENYNATYGYGGDGFEDIDVTLYKPVNRGEVK